MIVALELARKLDKQLRRNNLKAAMNANPAPASSVNHRLTWDEICKRFPDEWVVLVETSWENDTDFDFGTAVVLAHHKQRKTASPDVKAAFGHYDEVGCFWTGEVRGPIPRFSIP
ncbi:MAG TPA: hypothetical protein VGF94_25080 [Kofleriaceae bacterium]